MVFGKKPTFLAKIAETDRKEVTGKFAKISFFRQFFTSESWRAKFRFATILESQEYDWEDDLLKHYKYAFFVLAFALFVFAENAANQRMVILLKNPVETKNISVKVQNELETNSEKEEKDNKPVLQEVTESSITFSFNRKQRRTITLNLDQGGFVILEVRDFKGKLITVLVQDYLSKGKYFFEEDNSWKSLKNLKGLAFISLSVDGKPILKKLMAKMD